MTTWIVTTGNSDIILEHDKNWGSLYSEVRYDLECTEFSSPLPLDLKDKSAGYTIPARVLGLVYGNQPDYYSDLKFPLLDTYHQYFEAEKIKPERIIILLTDQTKIFQQDQIIYERCPYWQDTCTLKPLLERYFIENFQKKFNYQPEFSYLTLTPTNPEKGIDNWEKTLALVEATLSQLEYNPIKTVYISHQAGTPAISSAVQFVSLGRFKNVKFLVSNEYFDENYQQQSKSEAIASSNYWRGMQIQKAKQLIKNGLPGAALGLLEEINNIDEDVKKRLQNMVSIFNISASLNKGHEFEVKDAIQRVVDALDLIEIFFREKNYIQGISLLAAAHETFLKAAILHEIYSKYAQFTISINGTSKQLPVKKVIEWNQAGLGFVKNPNDQDPWCVDNHLKKIIGVTLRENIKSQKIDILRKLNFPVDEQELSKKLNKGDYGNFSTIGSNTGMLAWLCKLSSKFTPWKLLEFIGKYDRGREDDRRNQLMHNLVGVKPEEVIKYLLGNTTDPKYTDVLQTYQQAVKKPFLIEIDRLGLPYKEKNLQEQLETLANDIR